MTGIKKLASYNFRTLIWFIISFFFGYALYGCGASEPTFDGSSETSAIASLAAMFPEHNFSPEEPTDDPIPPALEAYSCAVMKMATQELFGEGLLSDTSDTAGKL